MKVLLVMHSSNTIYGAAKSLQKLIEYSEWELDIVYPKSFFHPVSQETIEKYSYGKCGRVQSLYLPFDSQTVYKDRETIKQKIWNTCKKVFEFRDSFRLNKIIEEGKYDYILLNSLVLYELISKKGNFVLYVREKFIGNGKKHNKIMKYLKRANKIIFIDQAITGSLNLEKEKIEYLVVNNPFDMRGISTVDINEVQKKLNIPSEKRVVFSMIGLISPDKGTEFIIETFNRLKRQDYCLLIVGKGEQQYIEGCKKKAISNPNIHFLGEQKNIIEIYAITDYVIRGDGFFATGRTVYEALYSGCNIIIQSDSESDSEQMFEYDKYKESIFFYKTRNKESLLEVLSCRKSLQTTRIGNSNIEQYMKTMNNYMK